MNSGLSKVLQKQKKNLNKCCRVILYSYQMRPIRDPHRHIAVTIMIKQSFYSINSRKVARPPWISQQQNWPPTWGEYTELSIAGVYTSCNPHAVHVEEQSIYYHNVLSHIMVLNFLFYVRYLLRLAYVNLFAVCFVQLTTVVAPSLLL